MRLMARTQNYSFVRYVIAALALLVLTAAWLPAASAVAGVWECISVTPDGDEMHSTLTLTDSDGKLSATLVSDDGDWKVSDLKFDGKVLSFTVSRDADYTVSLKVEGDKMEGTWSGGGDSGKVTATRRKA